MRFAALALILASLGVVAKNFTGEMKKRASDYRDLEAFLLLCRERIGERLSPLSEIIKEYSKNGTPLGVRLLTLGDNPRTADLMGAISLGNISSEDKRSLAKLIAVFENGYLNSSLKCIEDRCEYFTKRAANEALRAENTGKSVWCAISATAAMAFMLIL